MVALGGMLLDVPSSAISFCHRLLLFPSLCQLWKLKVFSGDLRRSAGPHVFKRASWPWFGFASALKSSSFAVSLQECPEETISTGDYSCRLCACVVLAPRTVASVSGAVTAASVALDNSMRRAERQGMAEMCSRDRSEGAACYESGRKPNPCSYNVWTTAPMADIPPAAAQPAEIQQFQQPAEAQQSMEDPPGLASKYI